MPVASQQCGVPRRLTRQSLLFSTTNESQTQTNDDHEAQTAFKNREREIFDQLPEEDTPDPLPELLNLGDTTHESDTRNNDEGEPEFCLDLEEADATPYTARIPLEDLQALTPVALCQLTQQQPEAVHYIMRRSLADLTEIIKCYTIAVNANHINIEQKEACQAELRAALIHQSKLDQEKDSYKNRYHTYREKFKNLEPTHNDLQKELASLKTKQAKDREETERLQGEIRALKAATDRGRSRERNSGSRPPRSESSLSAERHWKDAQKKKKKERERKNRRSSNDTDGPSSDDDEAGRRPDEEQQAAVAYAHIVKNQSKTIETVRDIPSPEKFEGKKDAFDEWLRGLENKLSVTTFRDTATALRWVHQLTKGDVWQYLDARVPSLLKPKEHDAYDTLEEMIDDLVARYGDRNAYERAFSELDDMKQDQGQSFGEFYVKFRRAANKVRLDDVRDKAKPKELRLLKKKLNARYSSRLLGNRTMKTLQDLVDECYELENDFANYDKEFSKKKDDSKDNQKKSNKPANPNTGSTNRPTGNTSTDSDKTPWKNRPQAYQKLQPLDAATNERCKRDQLCTKCEGTGHRRIDPQCPLAAFGRRPWAEGFNPTRRNQANASGTTVDGQLPTGNGESENGEATV